MDAFSLSVSAETVEEKTKEEYVTVQYWQRPLRVFVTASLPSVSTHLCNSSSYPSRPVHVWGPRGYFKFFWTYSWIKIWRKTSKLDLLTPEAGVFLLKTKFGCDVSIVLILYLLMLTQSPCRQECRAAHSKTEQEGREGAPKSLKGDPGDKGGWDGKHTAPVPRKKTFSNLTQKKWILLKISHLHTHIFSCV